MFQLASGKMPFESSSAVMATIAIAGDMDSKAPDIRDVLPEALRSNISSGFAETLAKALEKHPRNRFQSVDELATALHGCLVQRGMESFTAFISYRVFSEKYHAMMLYELLNNTVTRAGHRVVVYLDVKRLVKGEDWEKGFSLALLNSLVAVPLLSAGVLGPMAKLRQQDRADNVLKELIIMQAAQGNCSKLESIYPILVGQPCAKGHAKYPATGNFLDEAYAVRAELAAAPFASPMTTKAVNKFLAGHRIPVPPHLADGHARNEVSVTVSQAIEGLLSLQAAQLWAHGDLAAEGEEDEDDTLSDLHLQVHASPPHPPLDMAQLRSLRAELQALVPALHEVIDLAHDKKVRRLATAAEAAPPPPPEDAQGDPAGAETAAAAADMRAPAAKPGAGPATDTGALCEAAPIWVEAGWSGTILDLGLESLPSRPPSAPSADAGSRTHSSYPSP